MMTTDDGRAREQAIELLARAPRPPDYDVPVGADARDIDGFVQRTGLALPPNMRDWLSVTNGPLVGPGGFYGIRPDATWLDLEGILLAHPRWLERGWIPVAGDGVGNHYVLLSKPTEDNAGYVGFVDHEGSVDDIGYFVASTLWRFIVGLLRDDIERDRLWPWDLAFMEGHDPELVNLSADLLPWGEPR
jgi:cell wall assembly regulator SMI1